MKKILKWIIISLLILVIGIAAIYGDVQKKEHLRNCTETYVIRVKTLFSWYDTVTCDHYN